MDHPALSAIDAQAAAWSRGDLDGYMAHVHPDVVYLRPGGLIRGRDALAARYRAGGPMAPLTVTVLDAELGTEHASIVLSWATGGQSGQALVVFVPTPAGWKMRHDATLG